MEDVIVKPALFEDIPKIIEVSKEHTWVENNNNALLEETGFLMSFIPEEVLKKAILDEKNQLLLVAQRQNQIVGYILGFNFNLVNEDIILLKHMPYPLNLGKKKIFYHRQIAVKKGVKGVGKFLLRRLIEKATENLYDYIVCKIVHKPCINKVSIALHENQLFEVKNLVHNKNVTYGIYLKNLNF